MHRATPIDELATAALTMAVKAPSPYNTQPWGFTVDGPDIRVLLDRSRVLPVADPDARQARLACGAALLNLRLALRCSGRSVRVQVLPEGADTDVLALVHVGAQQPASPAEQQLVRVIDRRHTNRHPFFPRTIEPPVRKSLVAAARAEEASLVLVDAGDRYDHVVAIARRASDEQQRDERYQREAGQWAGGAIDRRDGVPVDAFGPGRAGDRAMVLRSFQWPALVPPRPFEKQPLLGVVLTASRGIAADVVAGAAMQRVLLTACDLGLSSSFVSQPLEVGSSRAELAAEFRANGEVHTVLRFGYGHPAARTPRRSVDDVTWS